MSQLYKLTQKIHELIDQLREKGVGISEIDSEEKLSILGKIKKQDNEHTYFDDIGPYEHSSSKPDIYRLNFELLLVFTPTNINQLLIELELGRSKRNIEYVKTSDSYYSSSGLGDPGKCSYWQGRADECRKTEAANLSNKWFGLREECDQAIPSLWDSGEKGQIQVLTELKEVLEGKLKGL